TDVGHLRLRLPHLLAGPCADLVEIKVAVGLAPRQSCRQRLKTEPRIAEDADRCATRRMPRGRIDIEPYILDARRLPRRHPERRLGKAAADNEHDIRMGEHR